MSSKGNGLCIVGVMGVGRRIPSPPRRISMTLIWYRWCLYRLDQFRSWWDVR